MGKLDTSAKLIEIIKAALKIDVEVSKLLAKGSLYKPSGITEVTITIRITNEAYAEITKGGARD